MIKTSGNDERTYPIVHRLDEPKIKEAGRARFTG